MRVRVRVEGGPDRAIWNTMRQASPESGHAVSIFKVQVGKPFDEVVLVSSASSSSLSSLELSDTQGL